MRLDVRHVFQIGDGARDFEDAMITTGAQVHLVHPLPLRFGDQSRRLLAQRAELANLRRPHIRVADQAGPRKALLLALSIPGVLNDIHQMVMVASRKSA